MYGTPTATLNQKFEESWENSVYSSLAELREQLQGLSTILSAEDDSYGLNHFHTGINARFLETSDPVDSIDSFKAEINQVTCSGYGRLSVFFNRWVEGVPITADINFNNYPGLLSTVAAHSRNEYSNTYLTFDINHSNAGLSNGFNLDDSYQPPSDENFNPELVLELNDAFWSDVDLEIKDIESQKDLADALSFELIGGPVEIDLSSIKFTDDKSDAIASIVEKLQYTVKTNQDWDLPFYAEDIHANLNFVGVDKEGGSNYLGHLNLRLSDHDTYFGSHTGFNNNKNAIERSEYGEGTLFEFGIADRWQLTDLIRNAQEKFNFDSEFATYELSDINFNFNQLLDGSNFNLHLNVNNPETSNRIQENSSLSLSVLPYNDYISDLSEEGFPQINLKGDFASVIDVWANDDGGPQLELKNGLNGLSSFRDFMPTSILKGRILKTTLLTCTYMPIPTMALATFSYILNLANV